MTDYDLVIVGGGINGCGIARDAAGRGLKVLLCEKGDLASSTSSASTKLIHGGLRYLEQGDFRLVRESLLERERLLRMAPHLIRPMRFVLPHSKGMRPAWLIRLGLFLYDHMGGRRLLPATRSLDLAADAAGKPLILGIGAAYEYSDCWVDDTRLVVLNALDAAERGADIRTYAKCVSARRENSAWRIKIAAKDGSDTVSSRTLVNAAGLWAGEFRADVLGEAGHQNRTIRMVRGSHIVVSKLFEGERAYILQNEDQRITFAIPYENDYTLIGTTECEYSGNGENIQITDGEVEYLLHAIGHYFKTPCTRDNIVWTYSGVRSLFDDGTENLSKVTRDYVLALDHGMPALLNIFGGKITTYRQLSEKAVDLLASFIPGTKGKWTATSSLVGGDFPVYGVDNLALKLRATCAGLSKAQSLRMVRAYGTRVFNVIAEANSVNDFEIHFGAGLYELEVKYMMDFEWAKSVEDILWRRSKFGLLMNDAEKIHLAKWMQQRHVAADDHSAKMVTN